MDEEEVATFLENQGVGTLSKGDERGGYGVPMSFGENTRSALQKDTERYCVVYQTLETPSAVETSGRSSKHSHETL
ncbi:hypothetical protein ACLI4Y_11815 [Natrialbaceae archaeon A-CW3]